MIFFLHKIHSGGAFIEKLNLWTNHCTVYGMIQATVVQQTWHCVPQCLIVGCIRLIAHGLVATTNIRHNAMLLQADIMALRSLLYMEECYCFTFSQEFVNIGMMAILIFAFMDTNDMATRLELWSIVILVLFCQKKRKKKPNKAILFQKRDDSAMHHYKL